MRISGQNLKDANFLGSYKDLNQNTTPNTYLFLFALYMDSKNVGYEFAGRGSDSIYDPDDIELEGMDSLHIRLSCMYDDQKSDYEAIVKKFAHLMVPELFGMSYLALNTDEFAEIYNIVTEDLNLAPESYAFIYRHNTIFLITDQGNRDLVRVKLIRE